jgi:glycosyltransferase involved in cell wall biosynthesis
MENRESKLRIIWICSFMNRTIHEKLGLYGNVYERAPWISLGIEEIKKREDIELYVIAPFNQILKNCRFSDRNIHYYCIKAGVPFTRRNWPVMFSFNVWSNFYFFNLQVRKIVKKINPDLINLHGAENAFYSSSVLHLHNYPILITIQGFISLDNELENKHPMDKKRLEVEKKILVNFKYFGIEATSVEKYIRTFNPDAKMFWFHYPVAKSNVKNDVTKEYDLVFFARITKDKGVEDLIKAVSIVKNQIHEISLCIIGTGNGTYIKYIKNQAKELKVADNIIFKGFIPSQKEMHLEVRKARISILPTYNDSIPGTIVESMLLGVPVICYNTGGIPDLNKEEEHVILVEQGNTKKLADEIEHLLSNIDKQKELGDKAQKFASFEFDNANSVNLMIQAYKDVIKEFNNEQ